MSFKISTNRFKNFLKLNAVSGETADGSSVKYFDDCVVEVSGEKIASFLMYKTICYISATATAEITEEGTIAFSLPDMIAAISDLEGDNITVENHDAFLFVGDGKEGNKIPKKSVDGIGEYEKACRFRGRIAWNDDGFYFDATPPDQFEDDDAERVELPYDMFVSVDAGDIVSKMKRLPFFTSVYYRLKTEDDKLGLSILHAKKGIPGEKFRWIDLKDRNGEIDVEFKEALQPVLKTIGSGHIDLYHTGNTNIPSLIYFEGEDYDAIYIVSFRAEGGGRVEEEDGEEDDSDMDGEIDAAMEEEGEEEPPAKKKKKAAPKKKKAKKKAKKSSSKKKKGGKG